MQYQIAKNKLKLGGLIWNFVNSIHLYDMLKSYIATVILKEYAFLIAESFMLFREKYPYV